MGGRTVVVGANGQLGRALAAELPDAVVAGRDTLDVTDAAAVDRFDWSGVGTVYNAAAYTAVDRAETERAAAWAVNASGPAHLARAAVRHGFRLVHVSTEYVFDGHAPGPVPVDAPRAPLGVYGASKAAGELAVTVAPRHLVVRTSWLVGDGRNFVRTMLGLAGRGVCPSVVADQTGRPTFAADLARALVALAADAPSGTYHVTGDGDPVTWAGLARAVFAHAGRDPGDVRDVTTAEYAADNPAAATARPSNSVLDLGPVHDLGVRTPAWPDSLTGYLENTA